MQVELLSDFRTYSNPNPMNSSDSNKSEHITMKMISWSPDWRARSKGVMVLGVLSLTVGGLGARKREYERELRRALRL
jgi:hypothetical protein